jgi:hypothetical protein
MKHHGHGQGTFRVPRGTDEISKTIAAGVVVEDYDDEGMAADEEGEDEDEDADEEANGGGIQVLPIVYLTRSKQNAMAQKLRTARHIKTLLQDHVEAAKESDDTEEGGGGGRRAGGASELPPPSPPLNYNQQGEASSSPTRRRDANNFHFGFPGDLPPSQSAARKINGYLWVMLKGARYIFDGSYDEIDLRFVSRRRTRAKALTKLAEDKGELPTTSASSTLPTESSVALPGALSTTAVRLLSAKKSPAAIDPGRNEMVVGLHKTDARTIGNATSTALPGNSTKAGVKRRKRRWVEVYNPYPTFTTCQIGTCTPS